MKSESFWIWKWSRGFRHSNERIQMAINSWKFNVVMIRFLYFHHIFGDLRPDNIASLNVCDLPRRRPTDRSTDQCEKTKVEIQVIFLSLTLSVKFKWIRLCVVWSRIKYPLGARHGAQTAPPSTNNSLVKSTKVYKKFKYSFILFWLLLDW